MVRRVVVQILLVAIQDYGNTPAGVKKRHRLVQAVIVCVQCQRTRLIVTVEESNLIVGPKKTRILRCYRRVDSGEIVICAEHIPHRAIHTEIQLADPALVGKFVGMVKQRVVRIVVVPFAENEARSCGKN